MEKFELSAFHKYCNFEANLYTTIFLKPFQLHNQGILNYYKNQYVCDI